MNRLLLDSLDRYVNHHYKTGQFLKAVLENNLQLAVGYADDENILKLREICQYIYQELPSPCHGSPEKVKAWLNLRSVNAD